jgi:hypothetical protein
MTGFGEKRAALRSAARAMDQPVAVFEQRIKHMERICAAFDQPGPREVITKEQRVFRIRVHQTLLRVSNYRLTKSHADSG